MKPFRKWSLTYVLFTDSYPYNWSRSQFVDFHAESDNQALQIALNRLHRILRRTKKKVIGVMLTRKGIEKGTYDKLYRTKYKYSGRRLLRIKNPNICFFEGSCWKNPE